MDTPPTQLAAKPNLPGTSRVDGLPVPPGLGELNYIQTLLQGMTGQSLTPTSSPTFAGLTLSGLTASRLVMTDAGKSLASVTLSSNLTLSTSTLDTVQDIQATSDPVFASLTLSDLTASVPVVTSALKVLTSQSYADFKTSLVLVQADIGGLTTGDSPTFTGLTLSGLSDGMVQGIDGTLSAVTLGDNLTWTASDTTECLMHFDGADGATTFTDETGRSWSAADGAQIDTAQSVFGGASGLFDGSGDYVSSGDLTGLVFGTGDYTIEFRARLANITGNKGILGIGAVWAAGLNVVVANAVLIVYHNGTSKNFGTAFVANTWAAISICRSSGVLRVFKDGVQLGTDIAATEDLQPATTVFVGRAYSTSYQMNGHIDELRISSSALYTTGYTPASSAFTLTPAGLDTVQDIQTTSSPTFAGLTLTAFSGFVKATAGVLSAAALEAGDIPDISATYVPKSLFDAHTVLYATTDNTPAALSVTEQTVVGRVTGGGIAALAIDSDLTAVSANDDTIPSAKATKAYADLMVPKTLFDANTILAADSDNTPAALTVAEQRLVGRITGGNIDDLTGAQVRTLLGTNPFVVGSDADGDMWYRASGALARMAKGTADYKLFMNAGATAPEWAVGMKIVSFTRDLSSAGGDQSITGVGFKGSHAIFLSTLDNSTLIANIGLDDGVSPGRLTYSGSSWWVITGTSLMGYVASGTYQSGLVSSWDADGFTITWTKAGSPTGTFEIHAIIFR